MHSFLPIVCARSLPRRLRILFHACFSRWDSGPGAARIISDKTLRRVPLHTRSVRQLCRVDSSDLDGTVPSHACGLLRILLLLHDDRNRLRLFDKVVRERSTWGQFNSDDAAISRLQTRT